MMHYQVYKALADQRTQEVVAAAKRHERTAEARYNSADATESTSHLKEVSTQLMALLHIRRAASARPAATVDRGAISRATVTPARGGSTISSVSGAGPIGCSA